MSPEASAQLIVNLLVVLGFGLLAGVICKRLGASVLVGYLVAGAICGHGGLGLLTEESGEFSRLAEAGALLLLFSIGIELSIDELLRMSRYFFGGGIAQMTLAAVPIAAAGYFFGMSPQAAILIGASAALSSTVLVYKALTEWGQAASAHGRRAVGILLFQDVALVPLMLLIPILTGVEGGSAAPWRVLVSNTVLAVAAIPAFRWIIVRWVAPAFASFRSTELLVLFTLAILGLSCLGAHRLGLPPALGAFAAGLILGGNRLTQQIDALVLPFRETFAAVFFVSLGTMIRPGVLMDSPISTGLGFVGIILIKTLAAAIALRFVGLRWRSALGAGLGLSQLGELSFLLLAEGVEHKVISQALYDQAIFIALGTLVLTPQLLQTGLRWASRESVDESVPQGRPKHAVGAGARALVIGVGPIGGQVASQMEISGFEVRLIDLSPVNLHRFASQGFQTIAGDATDPQVLRHADAGDCRIAVVTVPDDRMARQIVLALRQLNQQCTIVVRCRYQSSVSGIQRSGASSVVSEEAEAYGALRRVLDRIRPSETDVG